MTPLSPQLVEQALRFVVDPEIGLNVVDLGLIYGIDADETSGAVAVTMTLTTPNCPMSQVLPDACRQVVQTMTAASTVDVRLVWEPVWSPERISAAGRQQLAG